MADPNTPEQKRDDTPQPRAGDNAAPAPAAPNAAAQAGLSAEASAQAGESVDAQDQVISKDDATKRLQEALSESGAAQTDVTLVKQKEQASRTHQLPPQENRQPTTDNRQQATDTQPPEPKPTPQPQQPVKQQPAPAPTSKPSPQPQPQQPKPTPEPRPAPETPPQPTPGPQQTSGGRNKTQEAITKTPTPSQPTTDDRQQTTDNQPAKPAPAQKPTSPKPKSEPKPTPRPEPAPTPAPQPKPERPALEPKPTPQPPSPAVEKPKAPTPTAAPEPQAEPAATPTPQPPQQQDDGIVRRLRTYKDDAAQAMKNQRSSVTSVAAAAAQARAGRTAKPESDSPYSVKKIVIAILIALFIAGGIAVATWAFFASDNEPGTAQEPVTPTPFFFTDSERGFTLDGTNPNDFKQTLQNAVAGISLSLGAIEQIYATQTVTLDDGTSVERLAGPTAFLDALGARVESAFTRSLLPSFMFGGHVFDGNQPFLVFRTNAFEQAFAGMLAWEETMSEDLAPVFGPAVAPIRQSSSTPFTTKPFEDAVVRNQDARVLRGASGDIALLYTFPTRSLVIITTNEHTLIEIMTRMANARGI